jgi:hypothetical protein
VSTGPPGSTWNEAATTGPRNADSTRGEHFHEILHGRGFAYWLVLGTVASLVAGAWLHSVAVLVAGPLLVGTVALIAAFSSADRRAEHDFFAEYATARRLAYVGDTALLPMTPLLGAGDRRRCEHWMDGRLEDGREFGFGHYTYEVHERDKLGRTVRREKRRFTISVVDLEAGMSLFPGIFLCRCRGLFGIIDGDDWLSHHGRHEVELESASLCERYDLWVDDSQDELLLRELFTPSFEVLLAEHPLAPCFEYRAGTLVVYVERRIEDEGHLDWMRELTGMIAARIAAEFEELGAALPAAHSS